MWAFSSVSVGLIEKKNKISFFKMIEEISGIENFSIEGDCYTDAELFEDYKKEKNISEENIIPFMKDLILNKNLFFIVDGDEYCYFSSMVEEGLLDKNSIEELVPNWFEKEEY